MNNDRLPQIGISDNSPTKLTEFTPLTSEIKQPISSFSFSRLFRRNPESQEASPVKNASNFDAASSNAEAAVSNVDVATVSHNETQPSVIPQPVAAPPNVDYVPGSPGSKMISTDGDGSSFSHLPVNRDREREILYTRSLSNVLRRISSIRNKRSPLLQSYADSNFKQYWMPDSNCKECYECGLKFTTFRRRHHCRVCGQIFCSCCCNQVIPGKPLGCSGNLRSCTHCCKIVLNYIQTAEHGLKSALEEEEEEEDLSKNTYTNIIPDGDTTSRISSRRKNSTSFWEENTAQMRCDNTSISSFSSNTNFSSMDQMSTERKLLAQQDTAQLREIWIEIHDPIKGIELKGHRHRLRMHPNCIVGKELVDWLLSKDKVDTRAQATAVGQALVDAKFLDCITNSDQLFLDEYALYRPSPSVQIESPISLESQSQTLSTQESQDPSWLKDICPEHDKHLLTESGNCKIDDLSLEIIDSDQVQKVPTMHMPSSSSLFHLDLNIEENRVILSKPKSYDHPTSCELPALQAIQNEHKREILSSLDLGVQVVHPVESASSDDFLKGALSAKKLHPSTEEVTSPQGWHNREKLCVENGERPAYDRLQNSYENHEQAFLRQLLSMEGLSLSWSDIILPLVHKVTEMVKPDVKDDNDEMDIRQYIQFKKIPGGLKSECGIINGVVCTKNIAHIKMKKEITNPKILILSSPIIYQRQENKFLSLDPLVMQEHSYLKNVVSKIASFEPDVVLVEKTVSRLAQDFLLEQGITLVLNVKPSVTERVARCTQAQCVCAIDAQIRKPELGICHKFYIQEHTICKGKTKTLMYFDGCAAHLGCTITLRGTNNAELKKVKKIMQFMIYVGYNWRLERSFLMNEFADLPALPEELPLMIGEEDEFLLKDDDSSVFTDRNKGSQDPLDTDFSDVDQEVTKLNSGEPKDEKTSSVEELSLMHNKNLGSSSNLFHYDSQSIGTTESGNDYNYDTKMSKLESHQVDDFSDPLRSDDDTFIRHGGSQLHVAPLPFTNNFRKALDDIVLCCSPNIKFSLPFFESDQGRNCSLRHYFTDEPYWSVHLHKDKPPAKKKFNVPNDIDENIPTYATMLSGFLSDDVELKPWHPFISQSLTRQFDDDAQMRSLLADFRAQGGRIRRLCSHEVEKSKEQKNLENNETVESDSLNNAGLMWERQVDALDPFYHQRLVVLFCSHSPESSNAPNFCVNPKTVCMDYYGNNDITLGGFLERYCFRPSYGCPSSTCSEPMTKHIRKFAHENGCVQIELREMEDTSPVCQNTIVMWSWCRRCGQVTKCVPMSMDAWSLSFAKYLELRFHGSMYTKRGKETCSHSLHHDHYQYFEYKQRVVAFKYTPITLREFALPPIAITIDETPISHSKIIEEIKHLAVVGNEVYSTVFNWLITMKNCYANSKHDVYFEEMIAQQKDDHNILRDRIEEIQVKLVSPTLELSQPLNDTKSSISSKDACALMWEVSDCVVKLKHLIAEATVVWNSRMLEFIQQRKKEERPTRLPSGVARLISTSGSTTGAETVSPKSQEDTSSPYLVSTNMTQHNSNFDASYSNNSIAEDMQPNISPANSMASFLAGCEAESIHSEEGDVFRQADNVQHTEDNERTKPQDISRDVSAIGHDLSATSEHLSHSGSDPLLMSLMVPPTEHSHIPIASPSRIDKRRSLTDSNVFQNSINFDNSRLDLDSTDSVVDGQNRKSEGRGHERSRSEGDGRLLSNFKLKLPPAKAVDDEVTDAPKVEKKSASMKTMLTQMLGSTPADIIKFPFPQNEHHLLPPCEKVPLVVYEDEIGSIIAYALSSAEYEQELQKIKANMTSLARDSLNNSPLIKRKNLRLSDLEPSLVQTLDINTLMDGGNSGNLWKSGMLAFFRGSERNATRQLPPTQPVSGFESVLYCATGGSDADFMEWEEADKDLDLYTNQELEKGSRGSYNKLLPEFHITVQFNYGSAKFYCKAYFAKQFSKLREIIFPQGEEAFIRSLARCVNWQAKGGKSGSTFSKTHDDRFILKQMSRLEHQSFLEFAPHYFQHIKRACLDQTPTILAKIVGVYRIGFQNKQTNSASKMDLLVIENLFYGHNISQKFDLKGSVRNRLVNTSGKQEADTVLLDENLLKLTCDNPMFIRPHSKTVLSLAINSDTEFLSKQHVMDYSLLVGIDDLKQELVVGIIDYIRTFTFDKKIEMVVKSSGILGGQGKKPTILSPEDYRKRFCEAMDCYFLHVSDQWTGLGRGIDS